MNNIKKKAIMMDYIETHSEGFDIEQFRTKLSLLFGYYVGQSMDVILDEGETFTSLFNRQWSIFEESMVKLNELRPIDFELSKSTAALILTTRARIALGGATNLYLKQSELDILNVQGVTERLLGAPVEASEMFKFFATMDQFTTSE